MTTLIQFSSSQCSELFVLIPVDDTITPCHKCSYQTHLISILLVKGNNTWTNQSLTLPNTVTRAHICWWAFTLYVRVRETSYNFSKHIEAVNKGLFYATQTYTQVEGYTLRLTTLGEVAGLYFRRRFWLESVDPQYSVHSTDAADWSGQICNASNHRAANTAGGSGHRWWICWCLNLIRRR